MVHVTEHILFHLDFDSMKNVRLVSNAWLAAVSASNNKIWKHLIKNGNGNNSLRLLLSKHLHLDFLVPVEDTFYSQRFCNTIYYSSEEITRATSVLDFTIDYLPHTFPVFVSSIRPLVHDDVPWYHFEINDSCIVNLDHSKSHMLKYWSRHFLTSRLNIDPSLIQSTICQPVPGRTFLFFGDHLIVGNTKIQLETPDQKISRLPVILHLPLRANNSSNHQGFSSEGNQDNKPNHSRFIDLSHPDLVGHSIRFLTGQGRFLLVVFFEKLEMPTERLLVWAVEEPKWSLWKFLQIPSLNRDFFFVDDDYLIVLNHQDDRQFTFLVFSMLKKEITNRPIVIATIQVDDVDDIQYKNGFLVIASRRGGIRFTEVKTGRTLIRTIQNEKNFGSPGNLIRLTNTLDFFYMCFSANPPLHGTVFELWNFKDKLDSNLPLAPLASFTTFTGQVLDFKFDAFGIVAVMNEDGLHGIQVLSFLPQCSGCKLVSKTNILKRCSRCKRAKYCSQECQRDNWGHHKSICPKLAINDLKTKKQFSGRM